MNRQRKKPKCPGRLTTTVVHGGRVGMGDAASQALRKAGGDLGNQEIHKRVQDPASIRDRLLKTIVARLKGMRSAQLKEDAAHRDSRNLERRAIYRGADHQADPGRYRDVARRYQQAAEALAAGHLERGSQLLEEAFQLEDAAYESVPDHVQETLEDEDRAGGGLPEEMAQIASGATCARCALPQELVLADWIQAMDPDVALRGVRGKSPHNWWDEDQDDEEEDGDDG